MFLNIIDFLVVTILSAMKLILVFSIFIIFSINYVESVDSDPIVNIATYDDAFDDCYQNTEVLLGQLSETLKSFPNITSDVGIQLDLYMAWFKQFQRSFPKIARNSNIRILNGKRISLIAGIRSKAARILFSLGNTYINAVMDAKNKIKSSLMDMLDRQKDEAPSDPVFDLCLNSSLPKYMELLPDLCSSFEKCNRQEINNMGNCSLAAKVHLKTVTDYLKSSLEYMQSCKNQPDPVQCFHSLVSHK